MIIRWFNQCFILTDWGEHLLNRANDFVFSPRVCFDYSKPNRTHSSHYNLWTIMDDAPAAEELMKVMIDKNWYLIDQLSSINNENRKSQRLKHSTVHQLSISIYLIMIVIVTIIIIASDFHWLSISPIVHSP